ncbi:MULTISPECIES: DUF6356 family protein [Sphingomonadales]|uniref:Capsule biosynthesis protein n=2 Tax=Edaphosphingomonas TaxID=3423724 RepID=A0A2T4HYK5_9SPHN|nr:MULTISPECIES: DUF6356 family protein [Sphingomonas]AGH50946.1 hypothetical protein G432_16140 [Sphingomonas sp. MM-1]MDX3884786.1 DUF6356 family protein [Sphingomonas sp.]OHT19489.1 hypothetical protein BHE75_01475 [Sphingomonas haloaromaticamans]PTD21188.1 hypothetical protein CV103_10965 [Sphingomonas fennica]
MFDRLFLAHPRSVNESYVEHFGVAFRFGATMVASGLACMVHGIVPALFVRTGSNAVKRLHAQMAARQPSPRAREQRHAGWNEPEWQIEYEI